MPVSVDQLWQVTKAVALLNPNVRDNFLRSLASKLEGVSRPSNRQFDMALCAALAQYGVAAGRGVLDAERRENAPARSSAVGQV
jgi:hypothetical protein